MGSPRRLVFIGLAGALVLAGLAVTIQAARPVAAATAPAPSPSPSGSPSPNPTASPGQSSAPGLTLPGFDPQKAIVQTLAQMLYGVDQELLSTMQNIWNPMVAGTDNIEGQENLGFLVDNSRLRDIWGVSLAIATGSVLVLLFMVMVIYWMLGEFAGGGGHQMARNLVTFLFFVMLMSASYFLIARLIDVDNGLIQSVSGQVIVELRSLPAFQQTQLTNPSTINELQLLIKWLALGLLSIVVVLELVILFIAYFIRIVMIWVLVVMAPFALAVGILPPARGIVVYWLKLLLATIFWKFANVLVFAVLVTMAAVSSVAVYNVLLVAAMLFFMLLVPTTMMRALGEPSGAITAIRATAHDRAVRRPVTLVGDRVSGWWRSRTGA
jgi:hypothetical protein